jgi:arsenite oxidase small subunit
MEHHADNRDQPHCQSRRSFLLAGATTFLLSAIPGMASAVTLKSKSFERKLIGKVSELKAGEPVEFQYPYDDPQSSNMLVMLGTEAGGGVGKDKDIVAFNHFCTHMGGPLHGTYKHEYKVAGPCPMHLTTFDLTRHGMVVAGHATESLPQIMLEVDGDRIYAVGVMGLVYGRHSNHA